MAINDFFRSVTQSIRGGARETGLSRRDMLSGIGLFGGLAIAGPALLSPSTAEAVELVDAESDLDGEATLAQYGRRRRRGGRRGSRRRGPTRRYSRPHRRPHGRRYSYGNVVNSCRYDYRFRRNNPGLCHRVLGMRRPRRGACLSFGGITICG